MARMAPVWRDIWPVAGGPFGEDSGPQRQGGSQIRNLALCAPLRSSEAGTLDENVQ